MYSRPGQGPRDCDGGHASPEYFCWRLILSPFRLHGFCSPTTTTTYETHFSGEFDADSEVIRAYCQEILSTVQEVVVLNPLLRERITFFSERNINVHNPFKLADLAATLSSGSPEKLQAVLTEKSPEQRLRLALDIISKVLHRSTYIPKASSFSVACLRAAPGGWGGEESCVDIVV